MGIVLRGGRIVTDTDAYLGDVRLEEEKIVDIGPRVEQPGDEVIHVDGCFLFPGGIDPHTHFDLPVGDTVTADDFASGTKAAILGGTTTIIDFATQFKGETLSLALDNWHAKAGGKCYTDYGFHLAITDWKEAIGEEMDRMVLQGVSSFKFYLAYKNVLQVDDSVLLAALGRSKTNGALICVHCENGDVVHTLVKDALRQGHTAPAYHPLTRPSIAEGEATFRATVLAQVAQAPLYVVHLTCREALQAVADAKDRGVKVFAETCPQYLLLDNSLYQGEGFDGAKYVMSPPLRTEGDRQALWSALGAGLISTVATDHCSFHYQGQKELGRRDFSKIPNGIPGVEHRMGLLYTYGVLPGKITLQQFVSLTAAEPAKLFGLYPRKGTIRVGSDGDIVVWDPGRQFVITAANQHHQVDYTPYEGLAQVGRARHVFLRGQQVVCNGVLSRTGPQGIYLKRQAFSGRG